MKKTVAFCWSKRSRAFSCRHSCVNEESVHRADRLGLSPHSMEEEEVVGDSERERGPGRINEEMSWKRPEKTHAAFIVVHNMRV